MPAFNISTSHKYLVLDGIKGWKKFNSFTLASKQAIVWGEDSNIYEKMGRAKHADWFILASCCNDRIHSEVLGQLPTD